MNIILTNKTIFKKENNFYKQKIHSKFNSKGIIFISDATIAFIITLFVLLSFIVIIHNNVSLFSKNEEYKFLEEKTIFVADSFVKNYDKNNSLLGSCLTDTDKKRTKSNEINSLFFSNIKPLNLKTFFIKEIKIINSTQTKTIYLSKETANSCISIKRFAMVDNTKSIIEFKGCIFN